MTSWLIASGDSRLGKLEIVTVTQFLAILDNQPTIGEG